MGKLSKSVLANFKEMKTCYNVKYPIEGIEQITKLSDGAYYVLTEGEALWLIATIAHCQSTVNADYQIWRLIVNEDESAELSCKDRHGRVACSTKYFEKVTFCLPEIVLCVAKPVGGSDFMIMLPREGNNLYGDKVAPMV